MEAEVKRRASNLWVVLPLFLVDPVCPALASVAVLLAVVASVAAPSAVVASAEVWSVSA
jgi:hypothetical protein